MKYIVKNCPAITEYKFPDKVHKDCCQCTYGYCKDIDCIIKRVIDKCKEAIEECKDCGCSEPHWVCTGEKVMSTVILNMFEIEEVKE